MQEFPQPELLLFEERNAEVLKVLVVEAGEVLDPGLDRDFEQLHRFDRVRVVLAGQVGKEFGLAGGRAGLLKNFSMTLSISWMMKGSMFSLSGIQYTPIESIWFIRAPPV